MTYYVSITGLEVKSFWHMPKFLFYSLASFWQAKNSEGNIQSELFIGRDGVYHTLTVWKDRKSMMRYLKSGAHEQAMKVTKEISSPEGTKVYGYQSDKIPRHKEALALWQEHGALHGKKPPRIAKKDEKQGHGMSLIVTVATLGFLALSAGYLKKYHPHVIEEEAAVMDL